MPIILFQAYWSNAIQVADILEWILEQVGIVETWQTSFSISEEFLRRLFFIRKDKRVSRISLVIDQILAQPFTATDDPSVLGTKSLRFGTLVANASVS